MANLPINPAVGPQLRALRGGQIADFERWKKKAKEEKAKKPKGKGRDPFAK